MGERISNIGNEVTKRLLTRRSAFSVLGGGTIIAALQACGENPQPGITERVVEKMVTVEVPKIVTVINTVEKVVTVPVEKIVERVVTKEVPVEKIVTVPPVRKPKDDKSDPKEPTVAAEAPVTDGPVTEEEVTTPSAIEVVHASSYDGELVLNHNVPVGEELPRTPVGEAERADILEVSWWGDGFGGYDRAIVVIPRLGPVWQVNVKEGAATIATRGFLGTPEEVEAWAVKAHVPSFQQASRDSQGDQPKNLEVAVYRLNFEKRTLSVVSKATDKTAPTPEWVLGQLDVSFREGGRSSAVEMHVAK